MKYFIEMNDTIVLSNNHLEDVGKILENTAKTASLENLSITMQICTSLIWIVGICVTGYIIRTLITELFKRSSERRKQRWEEREKNNKKKVELKEMKLNLLKELCYVNENAEKKLKNFESDVVQAYIKELES